MPAAESRVGPGSRGFVQREARSGRGVTNTRPQAWATPGERIAVARNNSQGPVRNARPQPTGMTNREGDELLLQVLSLLLNLAEKVKPGAHGAAVLRARLFELCRQLCDADLQVARIGGGALQSLLQTVVVLLERFTALRQCRVVKVGRRKLVLQLVTPCVRVCQLPLEGSRKTCVSTGYPCQTAGCGDHGTKQSRGPDCGVQTCPAAER